MNAAQSVPLHNIIRLKPGDDEGQICPHLPPEDKSHTESKQAVSRSILRSGVSNNSDDSNVEQIHKELKRLYLLGIGSPP